MLRRPDVGYTIWDIEESTHDPLSLFYWRTVTVAGRAYASPWHAYQAHRFEHAPAVARWVAEAPTPRMAQARADCPSDAPFGGGGGGGGRVREAVDWGQRRDGVLRQVIGALVKQMPETRAALVRSDGRLLLYRSEDQYLGTNSHQEGLNWAGELLSEHRARLLGRRHLRQTRLDEAAPRAVTVRERPRGPARRMRQATLDRYFVK